MKRAVQRFKGSCHVFREFSDEKTIQRLRRKHMKQSSNFSYATTRVCELYFFNYLFSIAPNCRSNIVAFAIPGPFFLNANPTTDR
jgi:hypothetical protein